MKQNKQIFICSDCGVEYSKWQGKCDGCNNWNSIKEFRVSKNNIKNTDRQEAIPINLKKIKNEGGIDNVYSTGILELDRVLGKGIVRGSVVLLAGEPGIGKSTLFTQSIGKIGGLYVAGEESINQVFLRAERLGAEMDLIDVIETNDIESIIMAVERTKKVYNLVIVDSIQMMTSPTAVGLAGSVSQIRESTFRLIEMAKKNKVAVVIIGHITKSGEIAGPKLLEHMVDVVLNFEGERNGEVRLVRVKKNRYGGTDEVGLFKMTSNGLMEMGEKVDLTLCETERVGAVTSVVVEGNRPILVEVQALVTESFGVAPKRVFRGVDFNRGQLMVAVLQKSLNVPLYKYDVFVTVAGGIKVIDPAIDLAVMVALYSSYKNKPINTKGLVFAGEVSLLGGVIFLVSRNARFLVLWPILCPIPASRQINARLKERCKRYTVSNLLFQNP